MQRAPDSLLTTSDLAARSPFALGDTTIDPSTRTITGPGGSVIVEPRVMQVFVALADAGGKVVTRETLFDRCWGGVHVGDDSLNRAIAGVRRVASGVAAGSFAVETIPRSGYVLTSVAGSAGPSIARSVYTVLAVLAVIVAIGLYSLTRGSVTAVPAVAIASEAGGEQTEVLARDVASDLSRLAAARASDLSIVDLSRSGRADYVIRLVGERVGDRFHTRTTLASAADGQLLWSANFDRPLAEIADLRQQLAAKIGDLLLCALRGTSAPGERPDIVALRLLLTFCDRYDDGIDEQQLARVREITERTPNFARGWAIRSMAEASLGYADPFTGEDDEQRRAYRDAARQHLQRARRIDPAISEIYLAEFYLLLEPGLWAERLDALNRGMAIAPNAELGVSLADQLFSTGRISDAVAVGRRAAELNPLSPNYRAGLALGMAHSGDNGAARRELAEGERLWPGSWQMRIARFSFERDFGDPRVALAMLGDSRNLSFLGPPEQRELTRLYLVARADPTPANIEASLTSLAEGLSANPRMAGRYLQALVIFGRMDEAYRLVATPNLNRTLRINAEILFLPHMRSFRHDRRFMAFATRIGVLDLWRSTGRWPDFCADPDLPYDCRASPTRPAA